MIGVTDEFGRMDDSDDFRVSCVDLGDRTCMVEVTAGGTAANSVDVLIVLDVSGSVQGP